MSSLPSASSRGGALDTGERLVERACPRTRWWRRCSRAGREAREALLQHHQRVALVDRLALLAADLRDRAGVLRLDGHLHLHRLEDRHGVALLDRVPDGTFDFPHRAGDMRLDLGHLYLPRRLSA